MRPSEIRVFDGLRITTQHMEHLQGSLHSAVQDLRQAVGLGRVYEGFKVVAEDGRAVQVQPGLAFDFEKNRVVADEPVTVQVTFEPQQDTHYVCVKYDQVKGGQVEGRPTLIWDACAIELRQSLPTPQDNVIPIAKLVRSAGGGFDIFSLVEQPHGNTKHGQDESGRTEPAPPVEPGSQGSAVPTSPSKLHIRQGIARLTFNAEQGHDWSSQLTKLLRSKMVDGAAGNADRLLIPLAKTAVPLPFRIASLSCRALINVTFAHVQDGSTTSAADTPAHAGSSVVLHAQSTSHGEVTFDDDALVQFGISTIQAYSTSSTNSPIWTTSTFTDDSVGEWSARGWEGILTETAPGAAMHFLQHLHLLVQVERIAGNALQVVCNLLWKGEATEEVIRSIETRQLSLTCETVVGWKALGQVPE